MLLSELIETNYGKNINNVIYKITNKINGKCYIGQTKNSLRKRLLSHISHAKVNTKSKKHYFQYALLKYGINNFEVDILEICETKQLNSKEIYWISKYNSHDSKFGYNCTFGGDGCSTSKPIEEYLKEQNSLPLLVQLDYNYNLVNTYYDYKSANREIYKLTGYFGQTQYYCNTSRNIKTGSKKGGYIWMLYKTYKEIESK